MKTKLKSITFGFSESPDIQTGRKFDSWEAADLHLARANKPSCGYYKTDFTIVFEDGEIYKGRYDIGSENGGLQTHIREFCEVYGLVRKPKHFTETQWGCFKNDYKEEAVYFKKMLETYDI